MIHGREPNSTNDSTLSSVLAERKAREPIFHRPEFGPTRTNFEGMTVDDFREVGASGRMYSRGEVLDVLEKRFATAHEDVREATDFQCRKLAADVFLLTYIPLQNQTRPDTPGHGLATLF